MKKTILFISSIFFFQFSFSQEINKENEVPENNNKEISLQKEQKELTSNEKYAIKMLKSGYKIKSIILQTRLTKQRVKELKKEHL